MFAGKLIQGNRRGGSSTGAASVASAVRSAKRHGFFVGARVRIGRVEGEVIGYNVGAEGLYPGAFFPLLVQTDLGPAKCGLTEVQLA